MVKMIPMTCPKCGASIDVKEGTASCFCTYCGTKILIDDSNTKNVNIHQTITNEADIKRAENEVELEKTAYEAKQKRLEYVGLVVVCLVIFALLGLQMILG